MADYDYDLFVIGAGSGGVRAARVAAMTGARVAVAEASRVGGTCVIRGCVPKKFMVYASEFAHQFKLAETYGWSPAHTAFDWGKFRDARDAEVQRLSGIYVSNLRNAGCELLHGHASFVDAHTIKIEGEDERTVTADKVLIAVGGRPIKPDVPGAEFGITSDEVFDLPTLPKKMTIIGGGYIAVEFACVFAGLGVDVTMAYRGSNILRGFDEDVRAHLSDELKLKGVTVLLGGEQERIEKSGDTLSVHLKGGHVCESEVVLFATGRQPVTDSLNLQAVGVELKENGAVVVDAQSKTTADNIWAVGDATNRINLTPVAIREGQAFADTEFCGHAHSFDHDCVPSSVFSQPPVGVVGMTEVEARREHGTGVDIYLAKFSPMKFAFSAEKERMLMKLVVKADDQRVLGCHIVGQDAPEMIQLAAVSIKMGVTKEQWDQTCALHPTAAEELVTMKNKYVAPGLTG